MAAETIRVEGLSGLVKAAKAAGKETGRAVTAALKESATPVQQAAQRMAVTDATSGIRWSRMRIGVTTRKVYVAPATRRSGGSPRPNFGGRLMDRAMLPALNQNQDDVMRRFENALDEIADVFEKGT